MSEECHYRTSDISTMADMTLLPQAKSFAPSREDILSTLAFFFGDATSPEKLKDYSEQHAATCTPLPRLQIAESARFAALPDFAWLRADVVLLAARDHFPDAFAGSNIRLRDTLNNLILQTPSDWQTAVALPFVRVEGTVRGRPLRAPGKTREVQRSGNSRVLFCVQTGRSMGRDQVRREAASARAGKLQPFPLTRANNTHTPPH